MYYEEIDHPDNPNYSRGVGPLPGGEDVFWRPKTEGPDAPTERVKAIAQRRELWEPGVGSVHMTADELLAFGEECASGVVICLCGGFKFKIHHDREI